MIGEYRGALWTDKKIAAIAQESDFAKPSLFKNEHFSGFGSIGDGITASEIVAIHWLSALGFPINNGKARAQSTREKDHGTPLSQTRTLHGFWTRSNTLQILRSGESGNLKGKVARVIAGEGSIVYDFHFPVGDDNHA